MQCPVCKDATLVMSERNGIEIDYCPTCRGVWLDRGELDKIIARAAAEPTPMQQAPAMAPPQYPQQQYPQNAPRHDNYHHKRRKSFLEDLFD